MLRWAVVVLPVLYMLDGGLEIVIYSALSSTGNAVNCMLVLHTSSSDLRLAFLNCAQLAPWVCSITEVSSPGSGYGMLPRCESV